MNSRKDYQNNGTVLEPVSNQGRDGAGRVAGNIEKGPQDPEYLDDMNLFFEVY